ncbi:MAG: desulfoferrodoxin, partial [Lancefieldella parvula]|nr:desulfoferrodoxin [Lancefieldella parvula]
VRVGEVAHPMLEEHYIEFIALVSENGAQFAQLKPGQEPVATFTLEEGVEAEAYEYCNLHGFWKASL